ncbi:hypothetical protein RRG08_040459 [Elysia crispata]|uniref:Uncharacterized protein n=1 Tax=Elysia crispata TaxID=231223 RepID=A0AAE0ZCV4_9GAST|nr:hypothetical protein RRG08_040459 [Elysia crispata]
MSSRHLTKPVCPKAYSQSASNRGAFSTTLELSCLLCRSRRERAAFRRWKRLLVLAGQQLIQGYCRSG